MLSPGDKFSLPELEERVLKFWRENHIFKKSLKNREGKKRFKFFEGPPYANGKPGIHHVEARVFKDIILRYKTMCGYYVPRRAGWDTHGLPVEIAAEKKLGISSKTEIEKLGVAKFNTTAKEQVWMYKDEWEKMTERIGYWLDLENAYITYDNDYIETLWWIFKEIAKKKLLVKGHKVVPWCTRCGTVLASHELAQGYKEVEDTSVYVKFKLKKGQKIGKGFTTDDTTYILSWTTTPWTLPGNAALAVGGDIEYVLLQENDGGGKIFIAKERRAPLGLEHMPVIATHKGSDLVGLSYQQLFYVRALKSPKSHKIYPADFVTTTDGTGVVHTAVVYGEDDYALGKKIGLPEHHTVDLQGKFTKDVKGFAGLYVKAKETEEKLISHLGENEALFKKELYRHEYPFCWRCGTALLYYARESWFIAMSKLRKELLLGNEKINWVPAHLKQGRFGEWIKDAKDWAISRERYWGTPLPIWECGKCENVKVLGSVGEIGKILGESTNTYILVRHGEAVTNITHTLGVRPGSHDFHLTLNGRTQIERLAKKFKGKKVHFVYASDLTRTRETEEILSKAFEGEKVIFDKRLREIDVGDFEGHKTSEYHYFASDLEKFKKRPPNGESLTDLRARLYDFLKELERKHKKKTIVIVSHEYPIWMLEMTMRGWGEERAVREKNARGEDFVVNGEAHELSLMNIPRDETGMADLHRPYIDSVAFKCTKCGKGMMRRVREVADVWFDSGAMPFAQSHYPFENKEMIDEGLQFPADYIAEAIDQTRGWFYTLLANSVLLGRGVPYRNVVCLGLILDKNGQKMSKSKGNIVEPFEVIGRYGADAVRWYFYTAGDPSEPKRFDAADLEKILRRFVLLLYNSYVFFATYADRSSSFDVSRATNVLDRWILARREELVIAATGHLEAYAIGPAARLIESFVEDLSTWYIRRSRRRFQEEGRAEASAVLRECLMTVSKLLAPFMPFFAEGLYRSLRSANDSDSVHCVDWPAGEKKNLDETLLATMGKGRRIVSEALALRSEAGIKVRQPLASLTVKDDTLTIKNNQELLELIRDEVNVKEIIFDRASQKEFALDTVITPELREEGIAREMIRTIQQLRQKMGLKVGDPIEVVVEGGDISRNAVLAREAIIKKTVGARTVKAIGAGSREGIKFDAEAETESGEGPVWIAIRKI